MVEAAIGRSLSENPLSYYKLLSEHQEIVFYAFRPEKFYFLGYTLQIFGKEHTLISRPLLRPQEEDTKARPYQGFLLFFLIPAS